MPVPGAGAPVGRAGVASEQLFIGAGALLFLASVGATIYLRGPMAGGMAMPGGGVATLWARMPGQSWLGAAASFVGMWVVMMAAMMLPSLVPVLSKYRRAVWGLGETRLGIVMVLAGAGYFLAWAVCGAAAYPLGAALAVGESQWPAAARSVPAATGVVLLLAAWFQMTQWKARQLGRCRSAPACGGAPAAGARSAWRYGLRLGFHCTLCCAGFMVVLLVTGVMNLGTMAVVACAVTIERLAPWPRLAARAAGAVILGAGALAVVRGL